MTSGPRPRFRPFMAFRRGGVRMRGGRLGAMRADAPLAMAAAPALRKLSLTSVKAALPKKTKKLAEVERVRVDFSESWLFMKESVG